MEKTIKRILSTFFAISLSLSLFACAKSTNDIVTTSDSDFATSNVEVIENKTQFKIGICNYVDDASLNQIVANIRQRLSQIEKENNVKFEILYDNCNADSNILSQIVSNFIQEKVDLMIGVATPVAMNMQGQTEFDKIPVIFSAVSDPIACGLVESLDKPGSNISGTSDFLDTTSIFKLMFAYNENIKKVGLLYDVGQDSSTTPIKTAKEYLENNNIEFVEKTATNVSEVSLAVDALINEKVDAIFTPTDNTIMTAELSIYEKLKTAKIPHFTGADSFALNGAFLGYGVDYANLGVETANMVKEVLIDKKDIGTMPIKTFDNGTATINNEMCEALGTTFDEVKSKLSPYCTKVVAIDTAEEF